MKKITFLFLAAGIFVAVIVPAEVSAQKKSNNQDDVWAGPVTGWPRVIPARIRDSASSDLS
jgi:sirohydrochlorin ferrochelatase